MKFILENKINFNTCTTTKPSRRKKQKAQTTPYCYVLDVLTKSASFSCVYEPNTQTYTSLYQQGEMAKYFQRTFSRKLGVATAYYTLREKGPKVPCRGGKFLKAEQKIRRDPHTSFFIP